MQVQKNKLPSIWGSWILANAVGLCLAPVIADFIWLGFGPRQIVIGAIFGVFQCAALVPRSLRVLWFIPIYMLLWDPLAIVLSIMVFRYGDTEWERMIPIVDSPIWTWRFLLVVILQWFVLRYAFRMSVWWIAISAFAIVAGFTAYMLFGQFDLIPQISLIAMLVAGLVYGASTGWLLELHFLNWRDGSA